MWVRSKLSDSSFSRQSNELLLWSRDRFRRLEALAAQPVLWTAVFVVLGLALRCYHYLRQPSVWHDEAALLLNVIGKNFGELLGPLFHAEAAPPLFLWIEHAVFLVLGGEPPALRLIPFLASCASLLLLVPVARRVLCAQAVPWAVLLFACSDRLLWHACEAKPYALDVLSATVLLALFTGTRSWPLVRQLLGYTLLAPVVIFLCYPGCFLCGGLLVALLPAVWRQRLRSAWLSYGLLVFVVFAAFALLALGPARAQRCDTMASCWTRHFPSWEQPWTVPGWVFFSTLDVFRYCGNPHGQWLIVPACIGGWGLWKSGRRSLLVLIVLPLVLALAAACVHAYPYGGARVIAYALPGLILLIAAGLVSLFGWLRKRLHPAAFAVTAAILVCALLVPVTNTAYRVWAPWPRADCAGAAAYVLAQRQPNEEVSGNLWEYMYLFRHLGPSFKTLPEVTRQPADRIWLVLTADTAAEREFLVNFLPPGNWQTLSRKEFARTTVLLVSRQP